MAKGGIKARRESATNAEASPLHMPRKTVCRHLALRQEGGRQGGRKQKELDKREKRQMNHGLPRVDLWVTKRLLWCTCCRCCCSCCCSGRPNTHQQQLGDDNNDSQHPKTPRTIIYDDLLYGDATRRSTAVYDATMSGRHLFRRVVVLVVEVSPERRVHRQVRPGKFLRPFADLPLLFFRLVGRKGQGVR